MDNGEVISRVSPHYTSNVLPGTDVQQESLVSRKFSLTSQEGAPDDRKRVTLEKKEVDVLVASGGVIWRNKLWIWLSTKSGANRGWGRGSQ